MPPYSKANAGFILITTLLFLQVFSILNVFAVNKSIHAFRRAVVSEIHFQNDLLDERLLNYIEKNIFLQIPACRIPVTPSFVIMQNPHSWWENFSCKGSIHQNHFYYVVEFLDDTACTINAESNKFYKLIFLRVSARVVDKNKVNRIMRVVLARYNQEVPGCTERMYTIKAGRQSRINVT